MIERQIDIRTSDGEMTTFICHPERSGPHPAVIFYMDAVGVREELRDMARRLGTVGYYVALPNLYYRCNTLEIGPIPQVVEAPYRIGMITLMGSITIPKAMADTQALIDYIDKDPAASKGPMGAVGYCMSGQYAVNAAAHFPERIAAAASIYGVSLMTDSHDSPHLAAQNAKGEVYFACAEIDRFTPLETVEKLRQTLSAAGANAEVELYPKAEHAFCFPERPAYNKAAAERHWERLHALFGRNLSR